MGRSVPPLRSSSKSSPSSSVPPNSDDPSRDGKPLETETTRPSERTTTPVTLASTRSDSSPTTLNTSPSCLRKSSNTDVWQCSPSPVSWRKNSSTERRSLSTSESPPTHSTLPPFPSNSKHNACVYY